MPEKSAIITTTVPVEQRSERIAHPALRATAAFAIAGAAATTVFAAAAHAADIPFEIDGERIAIIAFPMMTLLGAVLGGVLLVVTNRYAAQPRRRFLQVTLALTALSCVPSLTSPPDTASKVALVAAHLLAAAVIIPGLARNAHQ